MANTTGNCWAVVVAGVLGWAGLQQSPLTSCIVPVVGSLGSSGLGPPVGKLHATGSERKAPGTRRSRLSPKNHAALPEFRSGDRFLLPFCVSPAPCVHGPRSDCTGESLDSCMWAACGRERFSPTGIITLNHWLISQFSHVISAPSLYFSVRLAFLCHHVLGKHTSRSKTSAVNVSH